MIYAGQLNAAVIYRRRHHNRQHHQRNGLPHTSCGGNATLRPNNTNNPRQQHLFEVFFDWVRVSVQSGDVLRLYTARLVVCEQCDTRGCAMAYWWNTHVNPNCSPSAQSCRIPAAPRMTEGLGNFGRKPSSRRNFGEGQESFRKLSRQQAKPSPCRGMDRCQQLKTQ